MEKFKTIYYFFLLKLNMIYYSPPIEVSFKLIHNLIEFLKLHRQFNLNIIQFAGKFTCIYSFITILRYIILEVALRVLL